jgi:hypothetical protein
VHGLGINTTRLRGMRLGSRASTVDNNCGRADAANALPSRGYRRYASGVGGTLPSVGAVHLVNVVQPSVTRGRHGGGLPRLAVSPHATTHLAALSLLNTDEITPLSLIYFIMGFLTQLHEEP